MLINADHTRWFVGTIVVTAAASASYAYYAMTSPYGPSGGSWPGLGFGIIGTTLMVMAGLLSARRKVLIWRLGSARAWMQMHLWFGILAVPFIWFHSGFGWGGPLTTTLMVLFYIVIASGIFGIALQQFLPAMMKARVPMETIHSQIDHVRAGLAVDAYEQVASVAGSVAEATEEITWLTDEEAQHAARPGSWKQVRRLPATEQPLPGTATLRAFYLAEVRPYLRRAGGRRDVPPDFRPIRLEASAEWRTVVDKLQELCEESRQLAVQMRLHGWLHHWLFIHAPLSFALFVLAAFHIFYALHY